MADSRSSGELIAMALKDAGTSHLFTLNGGHLWPLYLGAGEHEIELVDVRHEQTAAFAAEGLSKLTRKCGVAAVTAGPGVTNAISPLAQARGNDSPLFLIGGRAPEVRWGMGSLQEIDHLPLVAPVTKSAQTLKSPEDAYPAAAEGLRLALSQRTGPTFLDVPIDVFFQAADAPEATESLVPDPGSPPDPDAVAAIARLIRESERPVVIAGGTVWWAHAEAELVRFVEAGHLPVFLNGMARGMLPPDHRLYHARARGRALSEADLVLLVGVPLDFRINYGRPPVLNEKARIVYVDVDDFRKHKPAAGAVYGDIKRALAQLAGAVEGAPGRAAWLAVLDDSEAEGRERDRRLTETDTSPIHPARLIAEVDRFCDPDAVFVGDGGDFVSFGGRLIERRQPGLWIDPGPYGCLGSGPGYAIAAEIAHPDRQVVLLCGDGAFGFAGLEFDSMVRHRLPIVCVIGNNGIWALEKHPMQKTFGISMVADLAPRTRYDKVVEALGGHGELVERPEQIRPALERAFKAGVPACVNVICDPDAEYPRSTVPM